MNFLWYVAFIWSIKLSNGAKILALVPVPTRSHHILFEQLTNELADRGHKVTLITPFKQVKPAENLKEVIIPNLYNNMTGKGSIFCLKQKRSPGLYENLKTVFSYVEDNGR